MVQKNVTVIQGAPPDVVEITATPTSTGGVGGTYVTVERISIPEPAPAIATAATSTAVAIWDEQAVDTTPDAFVFINATDQTVSTVIESNTIVVAGLSGGVSVAVSIAGNGGQYRKNGGAWVVSAGTVVNGDTVQLRLTSSAANSTSVSTTLTISDVSDAWSVTTVALLGFTTLATITDIRGDQDDVHSSPLTSDDNGVAYWAFMNTSNKIEISRKVAGQAVETIEVTPLRTLSDQYHSTPSTGIDANGYLHVFGPMHWTDMDYTVSNNPNDVLGGFTRKEPEIVGLEPGGGTSGGIPNYDGTVDAITYPYICFANDDNPVVSYRMRVGNGGGSGDNVGGMMAGAFAKYNSTTGLWEPYGGTSNPDYVPVGGATPASAFLWSVYSSGGFYQSHTAKTFIDWNGTIHYGTKHNRATGGNGWAQDLLYFYSDDDGVTWKTADGAAVTDSPITITTTPSDVMTPNIPSGTDDVTEPWHAVSLGRPVLAWTSRASGYATYTAIYENGQWNITNQGFSTFHRLLIDSNNVWYLLGGQNIYVSTDDGVTWKTYNSGISTAYALNQSVDIRHFKKTNKIRYVAMPTGSPKTVKIVEFISDEWIDNSVTRGFTTVGTFNNIRGDATDVHSSNIVSDDAGNVYVGYVTTASKLAVRKYHTNGDVDIVELDVLRGPGFDPYHMGVTLGLDKNGYLHVFGPVHWDDLDYQRSNVPNSITGGFTRYTTETSGIQESTNGIGGVPLYNGTTDDMSYMHITYDSQDRMILTYRMNAGTLFTGGPLNEGNQAGHMGRYNTTTQQWDMLGGNANPDYDPAGTPPTEVPCIHWINRSAQAGGPNNYQKYAAKPFGDHAGVLHYGQVFHNGGSVVDGGWGQQVLYYYSDDDGDTWKTADGATVRSDPICALGDTPPGAQLAYDAGAPYRLNEAFPCSSLGRPVILFANSALNKTLIVMYDNGVWNTIDTGDPSQYQRLYIDSNNVWYRLVGRYVKVSTDDGVSWKTYDSGHQIYSAYNQKFDHRYFKKTNKLRYVMLGIPNADVIEFISDEWRPV